MRTVVFDLEANRLHEPDRIWCLVARDVNTNEEFIFEHLHENWAKFEEFARSVGIWVGHNILGFDLPALDCLRGHPVIQPTACIDTLVVSRYLNYGIKGGHSLAAWALRLGGTKVGKDISDWSAYTPEMLARCRNDVVMNVKLFKHFQKYIDHPELKRGLRTEHRIAMLCRDLKDNGMGFDTKAASELKASYQQRLDELEREMQEDFPPRARLVREITPRLTKNGTLHKGSFKWYEGDDLTIFTPDAPFGLIEWEPFNPSSPKQVVERMNAAGWKPVEKTKGHIDWERKQRDHGDDERGEYFQEYGWKVSKDNLATLPPDAPASAHNLVEYLLISSYASDLEEWLGLEREGSVHGNYNHIGAWTHRMSHNNPNKANIPLALRKLWIARPGTQLVGVDADGIQMRIFAHYVNDENLTKSILEGNKDDGTDIHSVHQRAVGAETRDIAKTFIYAWLLGAGAGKIAQILGVSTSDARARIDRFLGLYPGLLELRRDRIPSDARRGYFTSIDGRRVICSSQHLMLAGYLQCGEAVVMKEACIIWNRELKKRRIPYTFVNFVHDEWQTEVPDSSPELGQIVADVQISAIRQAGEELNLNIPLDGSSRMGYNWYQTH